MTTDEAIKTIQSFKPFSSDDLKNDNVKYLYDLTEKLSLNSDAFNAVQPILLLIEKYSTVDFGNPGPLIHFIESFYDKYVPLLFSSLERKPTYLTIWMLNRIINGETDHSKRTDYINRLQKLREHNLMTEELIAEVDDFVKHQLGGSANH
jgi:hypothetical protein